MKKLIITTLSLLLTIPAISYAAGDIKLNIIGDIKPNSYVTVKLTYPYMDLGGTSIIWLDDNEVTEQGNGILTHKVSLKNFNEPTTVTAIIGIKGSAGAYKQSITISPAEMDVIWEAQTAVPPFYRGKAMPSNESPIKTMAISYFGTTTPSSLINYSWKRDKTVSIGDGINILSTGILGAWENKFSNISVTSKYGEMTTNAEMKVPSFKPSVIFYENSPTQGILTQEVLNNNPIRNSTELSLYAIPFGFANKERNKSQILYEWNVGKKKIKEGKGEDFEKLTLSRENIGVKEGEIIISLLAQNIVNVMQYTNNKFSWKFTQ